MTLETVIADIELHCNNYFNHGNDRTNPKRNHTPEFINLAKLIHEFRKENKPSAVVNESVIGFYQQSKGTTATGSPVGWRQVFASELSVYKRLRSV
jgi:hypothetical protein